jgi:hypothetical protein
LIILEAYHHATNPDPDHHIVLALARSALHRRRSYRLGADRIQQDTWTDNTTLMEMQIEFAVKRTMYGRFY